jgi:hypothetical protein
MSKASNTDSIPTLPKDVLRLILPSENPFVADVDYMIGLLNALSQELPRRYGWRYRTAEAFRAEKDEISAAATDVLPINRLYWKDQLGNWEAYSIMNTLRVIDLARSCVGALARHEAVCASLLARSVLENAAAFIDAARTVSATITGAAERKARAILDPAVDLRRTGVESEELERYSLKIIFASRLPESETIYNPTRIGKIIKRVSKVRAQEFVLATYEVLCEAAHPNLLGRTLYIHAAEKGPWKGNELRIIGPGNGPAWSILVESIVAALSWGCGTQVSAFRLMSNTIGMVMARLSDDTVPAGPAAST